ncbi:MAG: hypothetical protein EXR51_01295 [Dehalococcoidia bacterium]|nr:hypothetical protein [Dehalococcoidia bacterium]
MARIPEAALVALAVAVAVLLALPNLESNPPLSYDEGYGLGAPHNLLQEGWYGVRIGHRNELFDTHLSTGPTVLLPVWAMFVLFGEGVAKARAIPILYGALVVAAGYWFVRSYAGRLGGLAAALLLAGALYPYSRSVLGETPGFFWLLLGSLLWCHGIRRNSIPRLLLSGIALGLAVLTKLALGPIILVGFGATLLGTVALGRPLRLRAGLAPLLAGMVPVATWYAVQFVFLGPVAFWQRLTTLTSYQGQMADLGRVGGNWEALAGFVPSGLLPWVAPAALFLVVQVFRAGSRRPEIILLGGLMAASLCYFLLSVGWSRYAYWFVLFCALAVGSLAPLFLRELRRHIPAATAQARWAWAAPLAVWAMLLLPQAGWSLSSAARSDESLANTVGFVKQHVHPDDAAGTTENEVGFVSGVRFTYPPTFVATVSNETVRDSYDWAWGTTDWVVTGLIGHFLGADKALEQNGRFVERFRAGAYRVFQRHPDAAPLPGWLWNATGASPSPALGAGQAGQAFVAPYSMITEVRVLLAGEGRTNNAAVWLRIYDTPSRGRMLSQAEISGRDIVQNKWYSFDVGRLHMVRGQQYYLELVSRPGPNEVSVTAWVNAAMDYYPDGRWWQDGLAQEGDLYFGVLGHDPSGGLVRNLGPEALWLSGAGP